jgi:hypothetical protein
MSHIIVATHCKRHIIIPVKPAFFLRACKHLQRGSNND